MKKEHAVAIAFILIALAVISYPLISYVIHRVSVSSIDWSGYESDGNSLAEKLWNYYKTHEKYPDKLGELDAVLKYTKTSDWELYKNIESSQPESFLLAHAYQGGPVILIGDARSPGKIEWKVRHSK